MKVISKIKTKSTSTIGKNVIMVAIFAMAMAFLETAVVIYLRELYYPEGFQFPLTSMDSSILKVELFRELATLIMLASIAYFAGSNNSQKFAYFLLSFAIWDLFYYVFLKVFISWPASVFTWDILFLLPSVWVGPVLAPLILSGLMIVLSLLILKTNANGRFPISRKEWAFLLLSSILLIVGFTYEYITTYLSNTNVGSLHDFALQYIPQSFNWFIFSLGLLGLVYGISSYHHRYKKLQELKLKQLF
jgi:hypothetical protein